MMITMKEIKEINSHYLGQLDQLFVNEVDIKYERSHFNASKVFGLPLLRKDGKKGGVRSSSRPDHKKFKAGLN